MEGGWPWRKVLLYRRPNNTEEMLYLEKYHSATSKVINESGQGRQKMLKLFGEMWLGAGNSQGAKVSPLRSQGQEWTFQLQISLSSPSTE